MTRLRTRDEMHGWTRKARLGRGLGPERIAAILSVVAVAVVAGVVVGRPAGTVDGGTSPTPSVVASPSAGPSPSPDGETPSAAATVAPWAPSATALLEADRRLIDLRERLVAATTDGASSSEIARELRGMNTLLTGAIRITDALESGGAPGAIVEEARTIHQGALDTNLETLQSSLQNDPAYRAGARDVVAILADLEAFMGRLANAAGLPPPDLPSASPS